MTECHGNCLAKGWEKTQQALILSMNGGEGAGHFSLLSAIVSSCVQK